MYAKHSNQILIMFNIIIHIKHKIYKTVINICNGIMDAQEIV